MYPTGVVIPKFYGLPKVHKGKYPPQTHSLKYWLSVLWGIKRHSKNNQATGWIHRTPCEQLQGIYRRNQKIKLEEGECIAMASFLVCHCKFGTEMIIRSVQKYL